MNTPSLVVCSQLNHIFSIRLNRENKKNAINLQMYAELTRALLEADNDSDIRVITITGGEICFTAGNDFLDFMNAKTVEDLNPVLSFLEVLSKLRKPIIAAVNGLAIGIGTTLLLHCDLVFAGHDAQFQLPFINLGVCPEAASSLFLPRLVGHQKASELLFLGECFDAKTALDLRIVNAVTANNSTLTIAMEKAESIAKKPPIAVQLTKKLLKQSSENEINQAITQEAHAFFECLQTKESQLIIKSFLQKKMN